MGKEVVPNNTSTQFEQSKMIPSRGGSCEEQAPHKLYHKSMMQLVEDAITQRTSK